jgi:DNA polymerase/3'-5' exonuclease PolX
MVLSYDIIIKNSSGRRNVEKRFDYDFALKEYKKLSIYINEKGFKCDLSGSLRRRTKDVGDIDFLVEGHEKDVLDVVSKYPEIKKQINRYEFLLESGICIHAIPEIEKKYIYTLWHSTGPKVHVKYIEKVYLIKGLEIDMENIQEEDIYKRIGFDYLSPEDRYKLQEAEND